MAVSLAAGVTILGADNSELVFADHHALRVNPRSPFQQAVLDGDAYAFFGSYSTTAADTVLYIRNTSSIKNLYIERIILGAVTTALIEIGTSAPPTEAGSAVTPTNLNRVTTKVADATCIEDQTGATTLLNMLEVHTGVGTPVDLHIGGGIVLGKDDCLNVDDITGTSMTSVTVWGYFTD